MTGKAISSTRTLDTSFREAVKEIERNFLPYQVEYLYAERKPYLKTWQGPKYLLWEKAVRCGATYIHSYKHSKKRAVRHPQLPRINEIFASKSLLTAAEYLRYHRQWAAMWNALKPGLIPLDEWTQTKCVYPGGDVYIVSSDPNAFRGLQGDISLDEFAFHEQQEALYAAAQSRIFWLPEGQVSLFSSHSHPETTFARLAADARRGKGPFGGKEGRCFKVTLYDAVEQGLALKVPGSHQELLVAA